MSISAKLFGPKSKYDKTLPYTYMAKIDVLNGQSKEPLYDYYFADTICGLIDYLDKHQIHADEVILAGLFRTREFELDKNIVISSSKDWLKRPELCRVLESHYKRTLDELYRGHIDQGECAFEDRDRQGSGPF